MDAIKGTMTEIYNDLSKNTSGNTVAEVVGYSWFWIEWKLFTSQTLALLINILKSVFLQIRRLRIEIEKLQWLHQQELSEMKHNLGVNFYHSATNRAVFFRLELYNYFQLRVWSRLCSSI